MKITADFACLLKKAEQVIREEPEAIYRPTELMFEMEEKDYDQAIAICRQFGGTTRKDNMCEELESLKKEYLNTNYDNPEERIKFLKYTQGWDLNPLNFPECLENELQYKRTWRKKVEISKCIKDQYYSTLEYKVLASLREQVQDLIIHWVSKRNYLNNRELMEQQFHHLCDIHSNSKAIIFAAAAAFPAA